MEEKKKKSKGAQEKKDFSKKKKCLSLKAQVHASSNAFAKERRMRIFKEIHFGSKSGVDDLQENKKKRKKE